ncbi:hypothetical protein V1522DRAFT_413300 [Lipomyces starkeyi]
MVRMGTICRIVGGNLALDASILLGTAQNSSKPSLVYSTRLTVCVHCKRSLTYDDMNTRRHEHTYRAHFGGQYAEEEATEHKEKSRVAGADTDLKQAMDAFLVRFDSVNAEVSAGQSQNAKGKRMIDARRADQDLTLLVRDKMLYGKRIAYEGESDGSDAEKVTSLMAVTNRTRKSSRRANARVVVDIGMDSATTNIVGAFDRLAAVIATPPVSSENDRLCKVEEKIQQLDSRFDFIDSALKVLLERSTRLLFIVWILSSELMICALSAVDGHFIFDSLQ